MLNNEIKSFRWISFVSKRFASVDRKGRSAVTSFLATLGICVGVMTLIVVISVMNGFQMSFIDSILEISSFHARVQNIPQETENDFFEFCDKNPQILSVTPFYEAQALMAGEKNGTSSVIIRAVPQNIYQYDEGFNKEIILAEGEFDLGENAQTKYSGKNAIVLGYSLANHLGVTVGDTVNLLMLSGSSDVELFSEDRIFTVTGIFSCG